MTRTGRPISLQLGGDRIYPNNDRRRRRRRRPYPSTRRLPVGSRLNPIRIIYGRVYKKVSLIASARPRLVRPVLIPSEQVREPNEQRSKHGTYCSYCYVTSSRWFVF